MRLTPCFRSDIRPPFKINPNPPNMSFHAHVRLIFFSQMDIIAQV
jgi:hypothetical protein